MAVPIINGRVGSEYWISRNFEGPWRTALGVPNGDNQGGRPGNLPIPPAGLDPPRGLTLVQRPDLRIINKNDRVLPKGGKKKK